MVADEWVQQGLFGRDPGVGVFLEHALEEVEGCVKRGGYLWRGAIGSLRIRS